MGRWTHICRQKKLPACQLKKHLWLQGLLAEFHFHLLGRGSPKVADQIPCSDKTHLPCSTKRKLWTEGKNNCEIQSHQAQALEPEESSVVRHPWEQLVKAISLISRRVRSVAQDDICSLGAPTSIPTLLGAASGHSYATKPRPRLSQLLHADEAETWAHTTADTHEKTSQWESKQRYYSWRLPPLLCLRRLIVP